MRAGDLPERWFGASRFAILLGIALVVFYFPVLFGGKTFFYRDFGVLAIPTATYHKTLLLTGEIPLWNPDSNCGAPFLAQWGTMVLYPLSLIYVLLPMPWALNVFCIFHLWLGGVGMYLMARRWLGGDLTPRRGVATSAAGVAGIAFTFNGIALSALAWPNYIAALALFPWVLLTAERAWNPRQVRPVLFRSEGRSVSGAITCAALVAALQLLAGVPELGVFTWIILGVLWLSRVVAEPGMFKPLAIRFVAMAAATAGLLAIQLFPFYELLQNSQRTPGFAGEKWALTFTGLANLVLPRFRTFVTPDGTAFQLGQEFLVSAFLGAPLLLLALFSWRCRERRARWLALLCLGALVLALGSKGFLYPFLTKLFPPLGIARYPVKFLFILAFAMPLLAAFGLQWLSQQPDERRKKLLVRSGIVLTVIFVALVVFNQARPMFYDRLGEMRMNSLVRWLLALGMLTAVYFAGFAGRKGIIAAGAFLILFVVDAKTHLRLNPAMAASTFRSGFWAEAHAVEKPSLGRGRIFISKEAEERFLRSTVGDPEKDLTGKRLGQWSHLNLLDRVPKVNGSSTLQVREQAILQNALYSGTNQQRSAWLDFLNVTYETSTNSVVEWEARPNAAPIITAGQAVLFTNSFALAEPFDFGRQVAIHALAPDLENRPAAEVSLTNVAFGSQEIRFEADASAASVAVIAQSWYPLWKAEVTPENAAPREALVWRANLAFQAVLLPAGRSEVRVYYDDHQFKLGAGVSGATLLVCALFWVRENRGF